MIWPRHVVRLLPGYCDGTLTPDQSRRVDVHLSTCAHCRTQLDELRFAADLLQALPAATAPPDVWDAIQRRAHAATPATTGTMAGIPRGVVWVTAGVLLLAAIGGGYWIGRAPSARPWQVTDTRSDAAVRQLPEGAWVETTVSAAVRIRVGEIGTVDVDPATRVQLGRAGDAGFRLSIASGTIHAQIVAPPRLFIVDTPASTVVDLGCAYTVTVGIDGSTELRMTSGWAALEWNGSETLVPAGAVSTTRKGSRPGTPYFEDAPSALRQALLAFDRGDSTPETLARILDAARVRDTLSLWHVLARADEAHRARVYERLEELVPPPAGVSRELILRLDPDALRVWREELAWHW